MLRRLRVLQDASATCAPTRLPIDGLFVSGAVAASSHHVLHHLGVTHIINCTEELLDTGGEAAGFKCCRFPLRDVEEEAISKHFDDAVAIIDAARAAGGGVLGRCGHLHRQCYHNSKQYDIINV